MTLQRVVRVGLRTLAGMAAALCFTATVSAQNIAPGDEVRVELVDGSVLIGTVQSVDGDETVISTALFENVRLASGDIASIRNTAEPEVEPPAEPTPDVVWSGNLSLGFNGSTGNTETESLRLGAEVKRSLRKEEVFTGRVFYTLRREDGDNTENRLDALLRNEWLLPESRWLIFAQLQAEVDQFQDYDVRLRGTAGVGYRFIDNDTTLLIGRIGAGAAYDIGGENDGDAVPEGFAGYEFSHKFNDDVSFTSSGEIYPSLEDAGEFRSFVRGALNVALSDEGNLSLSLGAEHRYESDVTDAEKSDVDYFLLLVYGF